MKIKRIVGLLLCFCMVVNLLPTLGVTAASPESDFTFDSATGTITGYTGSGSDVEIPAYIDGISVVTIGEWAFAFCSDLISINIPASVTTIGDGAFEYCSDLTSINIPASVITIGDWTFAGCSGLSSINIPASVTTIGESAFSNCSGLTSINVQPGNTIYKAEGNCLIEIATNKLLTGCKTSIIPNYITNIGDSAFSYCSDLISINIPDSVTTIGESAFYGCSGLTSINIPDSVTTIGDWAFTSCSGLTNINIPVSVTTIGEWTFYGCSGLTSINIPASVITIGERAFSYCSGLTSINVQSDNTIYMSEGNCLIEISTNKLITGCKKSIIPNYITYIGESAFADCSDLTSINIPDSITTIGKNAFSNCSGLTSINIPDSVTVIAKYAFFACSGLTNINMPASVTTIGESAFRSCSDLTSINIPDSVTAIGESAFEGCSGLTSINVQLGNTIYKSDGNCLIELTTNKLLTGCKTSIIPNYITYIGESAFADCSDLISINIPDSVTTIGDRAFGGCSLTSINIPNSVTSIGDRAFGWCSLINITFNSSSTAIYDDEYTIPFAAKIIGYDPSTAKDYALKYNRTFEVIADSPESYFIFDSSSGTITDYTGYGGDVVIPADIDGISVVAIGESAFSHCFGLTSISIPDSVRVIGDWVFAGCTGLISINVQPGNTAYMSEGNCLIEIATNTLISGCKTSVIPNYITTIGDYAFYCCYTLISINIPNSVTVIEESAFSNCSGLASINIPDSVTIIEESAFSNCSGLSSINIPSSVTIIGERAFSDCSGLTSINVQPGNTIYMSEGNCIVEIATNTIISGCKTSIISNYITCIGKYAFYDCSSLTTINIPDSVTTIENGAFTSCSGLTSINIPDSVTVIGESAFAYCSNLSNINISNSVMIISNYAFSNCYGLLSINIPDSVTTIENSAFAYCSGLTSINIPDSVTTIREWAFLSCSGLTSINIPDSVTTIERSAFPTGPDLININVQPDNTIYKSEGNCLIEIATNTLISGCKTSIIPNYITCIGEYAFYDCSGLTSITIPDSVTTIGGGAFNGCTGLTSINIPDSVTAIGYFAFIGCSGLTSINIPDSITTIFNGAFHNCTGLASINIPDSVTSIENYAFSYCTGLTSINIPDSVTTIGNGAFAGCYGLTSITFNSPTTTIFNGDNTIPAETKIIGYNPSTAKDYAVKYNRVFEDIAVSPESDFTFDSATGTITGYTGSGGDVVIPATIGGIAVVTIGEWSFANCSDITSINIPDSVTTIGDYAFYCCSDLTYINIPNNLTTIGVMAFAGCSGLTNINISGSVTTIGMSAFDGCSGLTSINIPGSVTNIGNSAFSSCSSLISINVQPGNAIYKSEGNCLIEITTNKLISGCRTSVIPNYITYIGDHAFSGCNGLTSINIPDNVTTIGDSAFADCYGLTSIYIPDSVTNIGNSAFSSCSSLTCIKIPDNVTTIGNSAFHNCYGLTSINIPESVTTIEDNAFTYCSGLTSINVQFGNTIYMSEGNCLIETATNRLISGCKTSVIPNYIAYIGNSAFRGCLGLTSINIPESVSTIGSSVFYGCSGLININIPDNITIIGDSIFYGCSGLTSINIPDSVITIGNSAFTSCSSLTSINIPASVTNIGSYAFSGCTGLTSITFNSPTTEIYDYEYTIPIATKIIGYNPSTAKEYAIKYNRAFEVITTSPESEFEFDPITGIITRYYGIGSDLQIPATIDGITVVVIGDNVFYGCTALTNVIIPDSVTTIGMSAFDNCSGLTSINIPASVTTIGDRAFKGCSGLISINVQSGNTVYMSEGNCLIEIAMNKLILGCKTSVIPNYITYIGDAAFQDCSGLTNINIPDSVTTIEGWAFYGCSGLTSINIPASVTTIGDWAFTDCSGLTSINIPASVTTIGDGAFSDCSGLTSINIPASVTTIGASAFKFCSGLTSINIPASVTAIGYGAFYGCSGLASINVQPGNTIYKSDGNCLIETAADKFISGCKTSIIPNYITYIGDGAFWYCSGLTSINIPDSVTTIGYGAFYGCTALTSITFNSPTTAIYDEEYTISDVAKIIGYDPSTAKEYAVKYNRTFEIIADLPESDFTFDSSSGTITGYTGAGGDVAIPAMIGGTAVTSIGDYAFEDCTGLTSVIIPISVINIGTGAFGNCINLVRITIPKSVTSIGNNAFNGCENLIISGYYASEAERYATEHDIEFITILEGSIKIIGEVTEGSTLTLDFSKLIPSTAAYTVQWKSGGIAVGTVNTYVISAGDVEKRIAVVLTGTGSYTGTFSDGISSIMINGSAPGSKPAVIKYPEEVLPDDTVLAINIIPKEDLTQEINDVISEQIVEGAETLIYTIEATSDNITVQPEGFVEITLPLSNIAVENLVIIHISEDDTIEYIYDYVVNITDNTITFKVNHFSTFILGEGTFKPVTNIENVPEETIAGLSLVLTGTVMPSDATNQTIVWSVANAGTTGASITGSTLNTTASGTVTVTATIVNGATANSDYIQQFFINVNEDSVKDIVFDFKGVAIKLIEPWGLRFYTLTTGSDFSSGLPFGTIVLHQDYYNAGMTAEEMMADPNAIILTSESGDSVLDSSNRIVGTMVGGIYTYTLNTSFYSTAYVVINGEYIFSPVNSRNIYDRVVYLKDNSSDIYVKPIYQGMYDLYTDVKSYHDSLGTVTIPEPETIKRGSECSPGTVAANSGLVSYSFKGVAIRLIEPWGLCFYTEMTTADMNSVTEFGTVVLSEDDYAAGMTGEQIRLSDNSYVFTSTDGTAVYDSSNRIVAKLVDSIYTYNMDMIFYTVSYAVIGGEYYYSDVNSRNMYDRVTLLKDTSSNVYVKEIYASMFSLYGAVDIYHRSLGLK